MKIEEERKKIQVDVNKFHMAEVRRILWKHSISPQEFFSYVAKLLATGDHRVHALMTEAVQARSKSEMFNIVHTDKESLYVLIEQLRRQAKNIE